MRSFLNVLLFFAFLNICLCVRPQDDIIVGNSTYRISNEIYQFTLDPQYYVPLTIARHTIYTATQNGVAAMSLQALGQTQKRSLAISEEDYQVLEDLFGAEHEIPSYFQVDKKKRSISSPYSTSRKIDLGVDGHYLFLITDDYADLSPEKSQKRGASGNTGTKVCLHIPFFTTCDNSADLQQVKDVIKAQNEAIRTELDSYKRTNDARDRELTITLNKQRDIITQIANVQNQQLSLVQNLVSVERSGLVQTQHGDMVIHAQVNALKRLTNTLLRFNNAMASTDARTVAAQPSMAKLFRGFLEQLSIFRADGKIPILDKGRFNFEEKILPDQSVRNVTVNDFSATYSPSDPSSFYGFFAVLTYTCKDTNLYTTPGVPNNVYCRVDYTGMDSTTGLMLGSFHRKHYGLYTVRSQAGAAILSRAAAPVVRETGAISFQSGQLYCVDFLGFSVLTNFATTPDLLNGVGTSVGNPQDLTNCRSVLISRVSINYYHYRLFRETEGIIVPFYSNCQKPDLVSLGIDSATTGYFSAYPSTTGGFTDNDRFNLDIFIKHQVSPTCYISVEPESVGLQYYIYNQSAFITGIPRGYKLNQFTINPVGELASSIEFVYTTRWAIIYQIRRTSTDLSPNGNANRVIVDEVDALDGRKVLFLVDDVAQTVIDESDSIYGESNNGRDCVQVKLGDIPSVTSEPLLSTFNYDLTDCFYQNKNNNAAPLQSYLSGFIKTSGIARYVDKFTLNIQSTTTNNIPSYTFTLIPRNEADFRFYIATKPDTCPQVLRREITDSQCKFTFLYTGSEQITFGSNTITFFPTTTQLATVPPSNTPYVLTAGSVTCLKVYCQQSVNSTYVTLNTPAFQIVSENDKKLATATRVSLDSLMQGALSELSKIESDAIAAQSRINHIIDLLSTIDFNVSKLYPYKNFTDLRNKVDGITDNIGSTSGCSGPFVSFQCWLQSLGSTLITILIVAAVLGVVLIICIKVGVAQKLRSKFLPEIELPKSSKKYSPSPSGSTPMEFQILGTN